MWLIKLLQKQWTPWDIPNMLDSAFGLMDHPVYGTFVRLENTKLPYLAYTNTNCRPPKKKFFVYLQFRIDDTKENIFVTIIIDIGTIGVKDAVTRDFGPIRFSLKNINSIPYNLAKTIYKLIDDDSGTDDDYGSDYSPEDPEADDPSLVPVPIRRRFGSSNLFLDGTIPVRVIPHDHVSPAYALIEMEDGRRAEIKKHRLKRFKKNIEKHTPQKTDYPQDIFCSSCGHLNKSNDQCVNCGSDL